MRVHDFGFDVIGLIAAAIETAHPHNRVSIEFPGCIHIVTPVNALHIVGDANATWGVDFYPDAEDVANIAGSFDLAVGSDSEDVEAIAAAYTRELAAWESRRLADAVHDATHAFFASLAKAYPESKHGDFPPYAQTIFDDAASAACKVWLAYNLTPARVR